MNTELLEWFFASHPQGVMFDEYVPLSKLEKKLYELFCNYTGSLFTKKVLHIMMQSMRRANCDPSIRYFMDTEDWYEALNAFDANDQETLTALTCKHVERYMIEKRQPYKMVYDARNDIMYELPKPFHPTLTCKHVE